MKAIVLAGGYATRLWPLTKNKAKPLLPIAEKPIINYVIEKIQKIDDIDEIIVSTNKKFGDDFKVWEEKNDFEKKITIEVEPTKKEGEKFGALKGIDYLVNNFDINEDCLIVGGDNLFSLSLMDVVSLFSEKQKPVLAAYDIGDKELAKQYGIVKIDDDKKIINFQEKPKTPESTLASTAIYVFRKKDLDSLHDYLKSGENKDSPGNFIQWLIEREEVYVFVWDGYWFDIGTKSQYREADEFMKEK